MNIFDKAIAAVAPETALKRAQARARIEVLNAYRGGGSGVGYGRHGASFARKSMLSWISRASDADADIVENIETLRARSRDLYMGTPLATGALKTIRTNVVGSGLALNAQIDAAFLGLTDEEAREWEANVEREWRLWAETNACDAERRQNFYQLQSLVLLSALVSGDVFVALPMVPRGRCPYDTRVAIIEADRVCNPDDSSDIRGKDILGGIEVGPYGDTVAYWVAKYNPYALPNMTTANKMQNEWKRVPAFGQKSGRANMLHVLCDVERPAQRRGVPLLAPVVEALKQLGRYTDAELMAAVVSGMFTIFIRSESKKAPMTPSFGPRSRPLADPNDYELGNGAIVSLGEGESIETANPGRPNTAFDGFVVAICRQIGAALEVPYELLVKTFNQSYSAARASLLEAWKMFRMRREWLVGAFCQPVYEAWLTEAVAKGRIEAPGFFDDEAIRAAWCRTEWFGDAQGQLDPQKEAAAAKLRVDEGFSTRERETAELTGMKYEAVHAKRKREEEMRRADGLSASAPAPVAPPVEREEPDESEQSDEEEKTDE